MVHVSLANLTARPIIALLAFAGWALLLVASVAALRAIEVLRGRKRANEFTSGVPHGGDAYWRLNRAHANAIENLPLFAAIVLGGAALGVSSPRIAQLAEIVVIARVLQSVFHVMSGAVWAMNLRFTAFVTQLICVAWLIVQTLREVTGG